MPLKHPTSTEENIKQTAVHKFSIRYILLKIQSVIAQRHSNKPTKQSPITLQQSGGAQEAYVMQ
jgi:hypothetical protein